MRGTSNERLPRRQLSVWLRLIALPVIAVTVIALTVLGNAQIVSASEPPPQSYPERFATPSNAAERDAQCAVLRARSTRIRAALQGDSIVSRLNWVRVYERKAERFLEEQCGDVDDRGVALSAVAQRSGKVIGSPLPQSEAPAE